MSARGDADPLAGATIVVHDLSQTGGGAAAADSRGAGALRAHPLGAPPPAAEVPASTVSAPDRWWLGRLLLALAAGITFGVFGHAAWMGRAPTPITFGTLGAAPKVEIRVQVDGAVEQPGVYRLAQGDRVEDAIKAAGGLTTQADATRLKLAERVRDEQRLDVPALPVSLVTASSAGEAVSAVLASQDQVGSAGSGGAATQGQPAPTTAVSQGVVTARATSTPRPQATARPTGTPRPQPTPRATAFAGGKVNVNVASQAQLEQLPGFGATSAQRIIAYRSANGPLRSLEDVRKAGVQEQFVRQAADYLAFD